MAEEEQNIVEIMDEEGIATQCEVYDVVEFEGKSYALLLPLDEDDEEAELIVLEYIEEGDECYFQSIDDEKEFDKVCEYIQSLEFEDEEEDF
jgi:uncharacterized protein YrzB (UPF0473 family)